MPIYEYYSPQTQKIYSFFARSSLLSNATPLCPDGKKFAMRKLVSGFSITGSSDTDQPNSPDLESSSDDPFSKLNPQQASQVMQQLESAMGGMDDENPDPRQMGALMRRMCDLTGEKMDGVMEEVVRKLEEGTSPEELEERMSEYAGIEEGDDFSSEEEQEGRGSRTKPRLWTRDPTLYELEDFLGRAS